MLLLEHTRAVVEGALRGFLQRKLREAQELSPSLLSVAEGLADLTLRGGKRIRPALAVAGYQACGGGRPDDAALASSSLELLQTYLLVHDDWMDGDSLRRGGPTLHLMLSSRFGTRAGSAAAVLAGDLASCWARELLSGAPFGHDYLMDAHHVFVDMERRVIHGQALDLLDAEFDIERLYDLKTGSYTVRGPLLLGAALAGADGAARDALEAFGRPLGLAFQIRDDLLGLFGDAAATGKGVGSDLCAGKSTWVLREARSSLGPEQGQMLLRVAAPCDLERALALVSASGAVERAEARIAELVAESRRVLDSATNVLVGVQELWELAAFLAQRSR